MGNFNAHIMISPISYQGAGEHRRDPEQELPQPSIPKLVFHSDHDGKPNHHSAIAAPVHYVEIKNLHIDGILTDSSAEVAAWLKMIGAYD